MACGCGRNKAKNIAKVRDLKAKRVVTLKNKRLLSKSKSVTIKSPITESLKRKEVCKICPYGSQTSREQKAGIYVCHKTNRLIDNLIIDVKFNCPIKRWN